MSETLLRALQVGSRRDDRRNAWYTHGGSISAQLARPSLGRSWEAGVWTRTGKKLLTLVFLTVALSPIPGRLTAMPGQGMQSQSKSSNLPRAGVEVQFIGSKEGVDFGPYLKTVYLSVKRSFFSDLPDSFVKGEKGVAVVRLQIQRDGTLSDKSPILLSSAGKKDMDEAALRAVRTPAPFGPLPEAYPKASIDLEFRFSYNTSSQEPAK